MEKSDESSGKGMGNKKESANSGNKKAKKFTKKKWTADPRSQSNDAEVLLKVGGLEYKTPGKRQRVVIGSIVLGLNTLLLLAVVLYFYNPTFKEFVYTVGR